MTAPGKERTDIPDSPGNNPGKREKIYRIFEKVADRYDPANERISLGMQRLWKRTLTLRLVEDVETSFPGKASPAVLDLCTGTGDIALSVARRRPRWKVTGLDFSPAMLSGAKRKADRRQCRSVTWIRGDAMDLPFPDGSFEAVSICFGLRNCTDSKKVLREAARVLKPGGSFLCMDSFVPGNRLVKPFYRIYFRLLMPILGGGRKYRKEYRWLQVSTEAFGTPQELAYTMQQCGMRQPRIYSRMLGACVLLETSVTNHVIGGLE